MKQKDAATISLVPLPAEPGCLDAPMTEFQETRAHT